MLKKRLVYSQETGKTNFSGNKFFFSKITVLCEHLLRLNTEKMKLVNSTENRATEMLKMAFGNDTLEQKKKAINNLLVLCRESEDGARRVWQDGLMVNQLLNIAKDKQTWSDEFAINAMRILDELIKKRERVNNTI
jgi:hypothetical protein